MDPSPAIPNDPTTRPTGGGLSAVAGAWRWVLAGGYVALGVWAAAAGAWHHGERLWPDGLWGLPTSVPQGLSLALVIGYLVYGLSWPVRVARPIVWVALGLFQLLVLLLAGWWTVALGLTVLHVLGFDPRWLSRVVPTEPEALFYDGYCGLCHHWVKLVMHADDDGKLFYFAPLQGNTIEQVLTPAQRESLPDSIVVRTNDARLLVKSAAVAHILTALGGWHRLGGILLRLIPGPVRDLGYDAVAKLRHKLFSKPSDACPMMPPELRDRFRF